MSLTALALGAAACGGGQSVARGFASTELDPTRDSTVELMSQYGLGILEYTTGSPPAYWTLNLVTGAVQSYGATMPPIPTISGTPPSPQPYTCVENYVGTMNGTFTLQITDTATNVETDVASVLSTTDCPGADKMLTAIALDANGAIVLESGPFDQLTPTELPVDAKAFLGWGGYTMSAVGSGQPTNITVLGVPADAPDQEEIDTIDLTTLAVTVDVPAVPASTAWATGATPAGSLQSTSVTGSASLIWSLDGHYIYPRQMSDGGTTMFAGPFPSGPASELAIFQLPAGVTLPSAMTIFPSSATYGPQVGGRTALTWQLDGEGGAPSQLLVWDDTDLVLTSCPSVPGAYLPGSWSPDGSHVQFSLPPTSLDDSGSYGGGSLLDLLSLGGAGGTPSCQQLVASSVVKAAFSPDGDFIFWLEQPLNEEPELFTAASDGSGAQMIGQGDIEDVHFIADGTARLELTLGGELEWMDLHAATPTLHHVAEQLHGPIFDLTGGSGNWLVMEYQWSPTDGSGTLALISRDGGQIRVISPAVTQYEVFQEEVDADGGLVYYGNDAAVGGELVVVYVVRGRNPSPQDGIWRATITPADLP